MFQLTQFCFTVFEPWKWNKNEWEQYLYILKNTPNFPPNISQISIRYLRIWDRYSKSIPNIIPKSNYGPGPNIPFLIPSPIFTRVFWISNPEPKERKFLLQFPPNPKRSKHILLPDPKGLRSFPIFCANSTPRFKNYSQISDFQTNPKFTRNKAIILGISVLEINLKFLNVYNSPWDNKRCCFSISWHKIQIQER